MIFSGTTFLDHDALNSDQERLVQQRRSVASTHDGAWADFLLVVAAPGFPMHSSHQRMGQLSLRFVELVDSDLWEHVDTLSGQ